MTIALSQLLLHIMKGTSQMLVELYYLQLSSQSIPLPLAKLGYKKVCVCKMCRQF